MFTYNYMFNKDTLFQDKKISAKKFGITSYLLYMVDVVFNRQLIFLCILPMSLFPQTCSYIRMN